MPVFEEVGQDAKRNAEGINSFLDGTGKMSGRHEGAAFREAKCTELNEPDIFRQIALFHLRFENLHPFIDGNGRTGRMLINLQLMLVGFLPISIKYNDVGRYYRCFQQYDISLEKGLQEMCSLITKYEHEKLTGLMEVIWTNGHSHEWEIPENDSHNDD